MVSYSIVDRFDISLDFYLHSNKVNYNFVRITKPFLPGSTSTKYNTPH